eukprot:365611-Chlamydomonas_euryale.AAC.13
MQQCCKSCTRWFVMHPQDGEGWDVCMAVTNGTKNNASHAGMNHHVGNVSGNLWSPVRRYHAIRSILVDRVRCRWAAGAGSHTVNARGSRWDRTEAGGWDGTASQRMGKKYGG